MSKDYEANIRLFLSRRCAGLGIPVSGSFELTPRCNLRCRMCYVRLTPAEMEPLGRELTADAWLQLAAQAKEAGMVFLLLTGGEPLLRSDFPRIYKGLATMGLSISINTNGTLLTDEVRRLWTQLPPAQVNVTLYGACREDYGALCGDPDAFDRVMEALRWLREAGILTRLNTTVVPQNLPHWEQIRELADGLGLELRTTTYCFPPARRTECPGFTRLSAEETAELTVRDLLLREGAESLRRRAQSPTAPPPSSCEPEIGTPMQCMAGRSQFWVTWNGAMTPCGMLPVPSVQTGDRSFQTAWEQLKQEAAKIHLCPDCVSCDERSGCMNCAAVIYAETGRFDGKPEYMCRVTRAYREALLRLSREKTD